MNRTKKDFYAVDVMKLIMALLVIVIHKPLFDTESGVFLNYISGSVICGIAVPFFFVASGYFFFRKINRVNDDKSKLFKYEKRLFLLYFIWTVIYLPCIFVKYNTGHYDSLNIKLFLGQMYLTAKNFIFSTSFVHFWYVNTLMVSVALIYLLYKKLGKNTVLGICLLITFVSYILLYFAKSGGAIEMAYNAIPAVLRNAFEKGLLCTSIGFYISKTDLSDKKSISVVLSVIAFAVMIALGVMKYQNENFVLDKILHLFKILTSAFLFSLCLKIELPYSPVYGYLRKYSTLIYFSHLLMMSDLYAWISRNTGITAFVDNEPLIYFITLAFAVCVSTLIIVLSKKEKLKFLRYLY